MSTVNKFKGAFKTKKGLKDTINTYLGQDITDAIPFKDYESYIKNFYGSLPKTDYAEGSNITLSNTLKGKLDFDKIYQQVEYIESTGTQYITTNYYQTSDDMQLKTKIYISEMLSIEKDIIGNQDGQTGGFVLGMYTKKIFGYSKVGANIIDPNVFSNEYSDSQTLDISIDYNSTNKTKTLVVNSVSTTANYNANISNTNKGVQIFANGDNANTFTGRVYYVQILENDILKLDLIPCYRKLDNVIGMYDKVEGKFYTNAGTGTFIKGKDVGSGFGDIVGYGDTKQENTQGYNLLDEKTKLLSTQTKNGITYTNNGNGTFNLAGTATADTTFKINIFSILEVGEKYGLYSSQAYNSSSFNYSLVFSGDSTTYGIANSNPIEFTNLKTDASIDLYIAKNSTINAQNVKTMLYQSNTKIDTYEPYTDGPSPNPPYPQEIQVVRGKNRANPNNIFLAKTLGTMGELSSLDSRTTLFQNSVEPSTQYTLSINNNYQIGNLFYYNKDKTYLTVQGSVWKNNKTIITPNNAYYISFATRKTDNTTMTESDIENLQIQLEKGSQATPYLPYNTLEIEERGKNLFNYKTCVNNALNADGTIGTSNPLRVASDFIKIDTTTYSINIPSDIWLGAYFLYDENKNFIEQISRNYKTIEDTYTFTKKGFIRCYFGSANNIDINSLDSVQLEEGSATTYELYQTPQTYQLSLGDKELAKTDIADEFIYDIYNDKVYLDKNTRKVVFNGTETWTMTETAVGYRFRIDLGGIKASASASAIPTLYCDKLIANSLDNIWNVGGNCIGIFSNLSGVVVICLADLTINTVEKFKTWLASNNLTAYLPLAETNRQEITGTLKDQIKALYNSQSFTGTTIIEIDGELPLIIKARALKSA